MGQYWSGVLEFDPLGAGAHPLSGKSFATAVLAEALIEDVSSGIGVVSTYRGELALRFAFNKALMEVVRKFFVSLGLKGECFVGLLDSSHALI